MDPFDTLEELLEFAIAEEEAAADYYRRLAAEQVNPVMRLALEDFARDEERHKRKLIAIQNEQLPANTNERTPTNLRISDYLVRAEPSSSMDYQEALLLAMVKEKTAFRLYVDMAQAARSPEIRDTLLRLAQEEAAHKLRFELEYDDVVMREN